MIKRLLKVLIDKEIYENQKIKNIDIYIYIYIYIYNTINYNHNILMIMCLPPCLSLDMSQDDRSLLNDDA